MPCCKCCCGNKDCGQGEEGKCCCGGAAGTCCQEGQYCCDGTCQNEPCGNGNTCQCSSQLDDFAPGVDFFVCEIDDRAQLTHNYNGPYNGTDGYYVDFACNAATGWVVTFALAVCRYYEPFTGREVVCLWSADASVETDENGNFLSVTATATGLPSCVYTNNVPAGACCGCEDLPPSKTFTFNPLP